MAKAFIEDYYSADKITSFVIYRLLKDNYPELLIFSYENNMYERFFRALIKLDTSSLELIFIFGVREVISMDDKLELYSQSRALLLLIMRTLNYREDFSVRSAVDLILTFSVVLHELIIFYGGFNPFVVNNLVINKQNDRYILSYKDLEVIKELISKLNGYSLEM